MSVAPLQQDVFTVLQPFIATAIGLNPSLVIQGLPNRTAMPAPAPGFVAMTQTRFHRLRTNVDTYDTTDPSPTGISSEQAVELTIQVDFYGPSSGDWATIFSTLWRDEFACVALEPTCDPLYSDDPIMAPLEDSESQYEQRWIVGARLQYNPIVFSAMQFANTLSVELINVDEAYPP